MKACLVYMLVFLSASLAAQDISLYRKDYFTAGGKELPYRRLSPLTEEGRKKYPLIIFLHGSFEKGNDNEKQLAIGGRFFLRDFIRQRYPAFILFPQCPEDDAWAYFENRLDLSTGTYTDWNFPFRKEPNKITGLLLQLVEQVITNDSIDRSRIYIAGLSQGGMGVLDIIARKPDIFAGALAICGAGEPSTAKLFAGKVSLWLFHGDKDDVVPVDFDRQFYRKLKRANAVVRYSEYAGTGHNSWVNAFSEPGLMQWLFAQQKRN